MNKFKLKELGTFKNGANYPKDSYGAGIPIVNVKDLFTDRFVNISELVELKNGVLRKPEEYSVCENDILFSRSSLVQSGAGMCALAHDIPPNTVFCGFIIRYRIEKLDIVNPLYLLYLLRTPTYRKIFTGTQQTNITNINQENLGNIEIVLPSLEVQNDIVNILNNIDNKKEINSQINSELESLAKTLYDYWFLQFEFPNENGKPYKSSGGKMVWNEELKREIPEGWKVSKIGDILEEANKSKIQVNDAKEKGKYPFFTSGEKILCYDDYLVKGFNIFLNTGGNPDIKAYMGKCAYSTDTWCVSAKEYSYILFYYLLKLMPQFEQLFFAGSGLKHLQKDSLKNQYILLPDEKVLRNFNNICELIWKKITNCLIENQELTSQRDFLLPLLMNGQVKFKDN